ncbi:DNA cytosine methyltransferase [Kordiimonas sp. SCSIO 12610]|uniref:DNA cytosine methyltransferase n=1 Tax=Kordiimonas sp. SCSIO 12610 TaxID=2829597 RepID=UPI00210A79D4|nr:DNA cytosine methyltransferase [Kordiimonas sp. SCSIO 12610]UTW54617.1 DNA cytosine methyltransferase [Kordiimonas sp. SCSIO 12610]
MALKYIDLFSGCGGLSLGLEQAGFELVLAVEKSDMAAETFYHNFIKRLHGEDEWQSYCSKPIEDQAVSKLVVNELRAVLDSDQIMTDLVSQEVDLVAGGPPCQGFSMAGRRNPDDIRNQLPWQFLEMVERVSPKAVIMENVVGMSRRFEKHGKDSPFEQIQQILRETGKGYIVQPVLLNAMHFGVPQHRPRIMILALRADIAKQQNMQDSTSVWKSDFDDPALDTIMKKPELAPEGTHFGDNILTVRDALWDIRSKGYWLNNTNENYQIPENSYADHMRNDVSWMPTKIAQVNRKNALTNHNLRNHASHIQQRFRIYQILQRYDVPAKVMGIPVDIELSEEQKHSLLDVKLSSVSFPCKAPDGKLVARSLKGLKKHIFDLHTKKHSQRPLRDNQPSPTVLSLPDDFVHPYEARTLTVREMARFQSFPDTFEFRAKETTGGLKRRTEVPQYTQVGNAVPPKMAHSVGIKISQILTRFKLHYKQSHHI